MNDAYLELGTLHIPNDYVLDLSICIVFYDMTSEYC